MVGLAAVRLCVWTVSFGSLCAFSACAGGDGYFLCSVPFRGIADSDSADVLTGISMGVLQVVGFAMIFLGAAIPSVVLGARLFGDWKNRSMFENCMVVAIAVVLIASGCGISSL